MRNNGLWVFLYLLLMVAIPDEKGCLDAFLLEFDDFIHFYIRWVLFDYGIFNLYCFHSKKLSWCADYS